jgi:hypothetical protein
VEELRYAHLDPDCSVNVYEGVLWDNDYVEFHDAAIADDGRAVVTYSDGATWVAFLDASGGVLRTEEAFDIGAAYGGHVAINKVTGAGLVGGQVHSGNGIYYRRFDAGFGWVDGAEVHMDTSNYHYWYDGYTVGMNDRSEFVFLWKSATNQMDARFFDAGGGHVNQISWGTPDIGYGWDSFRARHSEIPLRGDNFILGDVFSSGGEVVNHYEYTPAGALVSTSDTTTFVSQGLSIRTDDSGTALLREGNTLEVRLDYP